MKTHLEEFKEYVCEQFKGTGMLPVIRTVKGTSDLLIEVYRRSPKWKVLVKGEMYISYGIIDNEQGKKWVVEYLKKEIELAEIRGPSKH